jgi:rubrerythrin
MFSSKAWTDEWRRFLGLSTAAKALEILSRLYIEESQHTAILAQHASRMHYPQFRAKLLEIAAGEAKHCEWIGANIKSLGSALPVVPPAAPVGGNSWNLLLEDLEDESRCAGELLEQAISLEADFPSVANLLRRIYEEEQTHRNEIREMLMRSDPLSLYAA